MDLALKLPTKVLMASCLSNTYSAPRRTVVLPEGTSVMRIAELSRDAVAAFIHGAAKSWTKRELGEWLAGPYRRLAAFAAEDYGPPSRRPSSRKMRAAARITAAEKIESLLQTANDVILSTLMMVSPPSAELRFTRRALAVGHVVRSRDFTRREGWVPVDVPGASLADRILSLVTVDYLMRPADYIALLSVCGACQTISFDAQARVRGHCLCASRSDLTTR